MAGMIVLPDSGQHEVCVCTRIVPSSNAIAMITLWPA